MSIGRIAKFRYYGIALFEIEVIYDTLRGPFEVVEEQLSIDDSRYVSMVEIEFPIPFGESFLNFLQWIDGSKLRALLKK